MKLQRDQTPPWTLAIYLRDSSHFIEFEEFLNLNKLPKEFDEAYDALETLLGPSPLYIRSITYTKVHIRN